MTKDKIDALGLDLKNMSDDDLLQFVRGLRQDRITKKEKKAPKAKQKKDGKAKFRQMVAKMSPEEKRKLLEQLQGGK